MKPIPKNAATRRREIAIQIDDLIREIRGTNSYRVAPQSAVASKSKNQIIIRIRHKDGACLTEEEAKAYLAYLQAGHTGSPFDARTDPNPPKRRYRVTGLIETRGEVIVEASSESAARLAAYRAPRSQWTQLPWLPPVLDETGEIDAHEGPSFPLDLWDIEDLAEPQAVAAPAPPAPKSPSFDAQTAKRIASLYAGRFDALSEALYAAIRGIPADDALAILDEIPDMIEGIREAWLDTAGMAADAASNDDAPEAP